MTTTITSRQARLARARQTQRRIGGTALEPPAGGDLHELAKSFGRDLRARQVSSSTERLYLTGVALLGRFLAERTMPLVAANISAEHIREWLIDLAQDHSAATVQNRFKAAKAFFKWLESEGEISTSPMAKLKTPPVPEQPPSLITDDTVRALLRACEGQGFEERRDTAIIRVLLDTGCRRAELAYLRLSDVDLDAGHMTVLGKGGRRRTVGLGRKAAAALDRYLRVRGRHKHAWSDRLWLGRLGPLVDGAIALMLQRRAKQAGLAENVHAHQFRHLLAHRWKLAEGSEEALMQQAGWRSRTMMARYGASAAAERSLDVKRRLALGDRL